MTATVLNIALWLFSITGFIIWNLYQKNVKMEQMLSNYESLFERLKTEIQNSDKMIKELDKRGIFKSDDEVGAFFTLVKDIQESLNGYFRQ